MTRPMPKNTATARQLNDLPRGFSEIQREMQQQDRTTRRDVLKALRNAGEILKICDGLLSHVPHDARDRSPLSSGEDAKLSRWVSRACEGDGRGLYPLRRWCSANPRSLTGIGCINEALVEELDRLAANNVNIRTHSLRDLAACHLGQWLTVPETRDARVRADYATACWLYLMAWAGMLSQRVTAKECDIVEEIESAIARLCVAIDEVPYDAERGNNDIDHGGLDHGCNSPHVAHIA